MKGMQGFVLEFEGLGGFGAEDLGLWVRGVWDLGLEFGAALNPKPLHRLRLEWC